jgi:tetratricopeptide (TPR) repeat protein
MWRATIATKVDTIHNDTIWTAKPFYEKYIELAAPDTVNLAKNKTNLLASYNYLAFYYVQQEDYVKAKEYYQKILDLEPGDVDTIESLKLLSGLKKR